MMAYDGVSGRSSGREEHLAAFGIGKKKTLLCHSSDLQCMRNSWYLCCCYFGMWSFRVRTTEGRILLAKQNFQGKRLPLVLA